MIQHFLTVLCPDFDGKFFFPLWFAQATIHDTFPMPQESKLVWISCKDFATANLLKRKVALLGVFTPWKFSQWGSIRLNNIKIEDDLITSVPTCSPLSWNIRLASPTYLPKQFEYIARDQFDCCDQAGRGMIKLIEMVGMSNLGALWNFKLKFLDKMYGRHQQVGVASGSWAEVQWGYITAWQMKIGAGSWVESISCKNLRMKQPWINRSLHSIVSGSSHCRCPLSTSSQPLASPFYLFNVPCCFLTLGRNSYTWKKPNEEDFPSTAKDKFLWYLNPLLPESLPKPVMQQGRKFDHHVIMEMTEFPRCIGPIIQVCCRKCWMAIFHGKWCKMTTVE